jgi:CubicO group peptidase (beta-lactamase class C family)
MKRSVIILLVLVVICFTAGCNTEGRIKKQIAEVENNLLPANIFEGEKPYNIQERMELYKVPGVSITVIKDFKIQWTKHYGLADQELNIPVTDQTIFNIGSLSKAVAAFTTLSIIEKGELDLDEDVNQRLTSWKIPQNEFTEEAIITPRLLMNHSSGAMFYPGAIYTRENFPTITQYLKGEAPAHKPPTIIDRTPGTEFAYSNPGFSILQQLIEDIAHEKYHKIAQKNIFNVLDMQNTTVEQPIPLELEKYASAGHYVFGRKYPEKHYYYPNAAAGGVWTTTEDYAKFIVEIQKSYHGKSNKVISQDLVREMIKPHVSKNYGLGVFIRGEDYFGHMGDNAGFFASFLSHNTNGNGVVVFTNSNSSAELLREITNAVVKVYDWEGLLPEPYKIQAFSDDEKIKIAGRYKIGSDQILEIELKDGELILPAYENEKLYYIGGNTFKIKRRLGGITFTDDSYTRMKYAFANNLQQLPAEREAVKMKEGEKLPYEYLADGEFEQAMKMCREILERTPNDIAVSENYLNRLGYQMIEQKKYIHALHTFELLIEFYPTSANAYDSYAEALALNGRTKEAIKNYEKALELNPGSQNAREMIKKLKK